MRALNMDKSPGPDRIGHGWVPDAVQNSRAAGARPFCLGFGIWGFLMTLEGVDKVKKILVPTKGSREGQASSAGVLGCVFVGFLGEGGLDMVGFVSLQVIPHRSVGRHLVLDLMLGRSRGMEELMIPFLCV